MARITAIINQKGGVGKTSTAAALASGLKEKGFSVLSVDLDSQGSLSYILDTRATYGTYDALNTGSAAKFIIPTNTGDLLASTPALTRADLEFTKAGREYLLKNALARVKARYSHIVIDCPPHIGILTVNALAAADDIIIPLNADILSLQGLGQLYDSYSTVKADCNAKLSIAGILITRYRKTSLARDMASVMEDEAAQMTIHVYNVRIREGVAVKEAQVMRESIFARNAKTGPAADYAAFVEEYLEQEQKK